MQNPAMAAALGVSPPRIYMATFGLGAALTGLAGGVLAPISGVSPVMGAAYVAKAFITVIGGGAAIVTGVGAASVLFGAINQIATYATTPVFGEVALLDGGNRSADATAITNCRLLVFERSGFLDLLRGNWLLTEAVLKLVCTRLRQADDGLADLAFFDVPGRLAKTLLARARPAPGGGPSHVSDTQGALAAMAGSSRETVNRTLRKWAKSGLVAIADGRIFLLDRDALARIAQ